MTSDSFASESVWGLRPDRASGNAVTPFIQDLQGVAVELPGPGLHVLDRSELSR